MKGAPAPTRRRPSASRSPPPVAYQVTQRAGLVTVSNQLPQQTIWGFDGISPGPTYVAQYGTPVLVRNVNALAGDNSGFGFPSVTTHLHNAHTPSESDGFPQDFFASGQYYDHYYPNVLAGFNSTHLPNGDVNESLSTLWYHDHRVDFTSQNVYKGLAGFYLLFNQFDTGNETTGFRLPSFPDYDIPMMFADKCFDPTSGHAGLRHLQPGRHSGRQVPGQRRDPAGAARPSPALPLPLAQQRPVALPAVLPDGPRPT